MQTIWGIDLGGTKIEGVVLSSPSPDAVVIRKRIDTESHKGYQHIANQIVRLIHELEAETGYRAESVGLGTPGTVEPSNGLMKNCNTTCLNGMPLKDDLIKALNIPGRHSQRCQLFCACRSNDGDCSRCGSRFQLRIWRYYGGIFLCRRWGCISRKRRSAFRFERSARNWRRMGT